MAFDKLLWSTESSPRLTPVEPGSAPFFCFALLTVSCAVASLAFACATPFAAFAVVAAAMLPLIPAFAVVTGAWLVSQGIGFGALHYPVDANTMLWGLAIGVAALVATAASALVLCIFPRNVTPVRLALALVCALVGAYCCYELVIFAATPFLGGAENFSLPVIAQLGGLSIAWLSALVAVCEIARLFYSERPGRAAV